MTCCGKPMRREGAVYVCGRCGASWDPGVQPRRLVAAGIIARRISGRSLRLTVTASGVTGHLRPRAPWPPPGGASDGSQGLRPVTAPR